MTRCCILGCGRVARAVVSVLPVEWTVIGVDISEEPLREIRKYRPHVDVMCCGDIYPVVRELAGRVDVFVNLLPGNVGGEVTLELAHLGARVVDVSFWEGNREEVDRVARELGAVVVFDCGIAPGVPNVVLGALLASGRHVEEFRYWVGGLPRARKWPHQYAAVFSVVDVLAEYVRPARVKVNGQVVEFDPLEGPVHLLEVEGVGTLEAFPTDGLRTLLSLPVPNMAEYTLRYPAHRSLMLALREMGFFKPSVIDFTAKVLAESWQLKPSEKEFTYLRAKARTTAGEEFVLSLWDEGPDKRGLLSMSRCTGFTAAFVVMKIVEEAIAVPPGAYGLEKVSDESILKGLLEFLSKQGIEVEWSARESNP